MAVSIITLSDRHLEVNNKTVKKCTDGQWQTDEELTPSEERALKAHIKVLS